VKTEVVGPLSPLQVTAAPVGAVVKPSRYAFADSLKVLLVAA
jgi:hypothetical protein